jgi:hypothetical protein
VVTCIGALLLGVSAVRAGGASASAQCAAAWSADAPSPASAPIVLHGLGVVSPAEVWAVGSFQSREFGKDVFAERWTGSRWQPTVVPDDHAQNTEYQLNAVSGSGPSDVWAVGESDYTDEGTDATPLFEHYDGTSWSQMPAPSPFDFTMTGVASVSPDDAWAVGYDSNRDHGVSVPPLVEHWDGLAWSIVTTDVAKGDLFGIGALSADDIWAVGWDENAKPLLEHWDGSSWSRVAGPSLSQSGRLSAVSGSSAHDVWAVGEVDPYGEGGALIEHWDGSTWSVVATAAGSPATLTAVAALSPTDAWAAGAGLIEHWNGGHWTVSTSIGGAGLLGAVGPGDVWSGGPPISHWNGSSWQPVASPTGVDLPTTASAVTPSGFVVGSYVDVFGRRRLFAPTWVSNVGLGDNRLRGAADVPSGGSFAVGDYVASGAHHALIRSFGGGIEDGTGPDGILRGASAVTGSDAWAVGATDDGRTLVEHFDGASWAVVPSPNVGAGDVLTDVAAIAPSDVWAVGSAGATGDATTLIEHYDGAVWSIVPSPNAGSGDNALSGVFASAPGDLWAVGSFVGPSGALRTLVEHWDGGSWTVVPSPNQGPGENVLSSVSGRPGAAPWAVGHAVVSGETVPLIEFWDGTVWRRATLAGDAASPGASLTSVASGGSISGAPITRVVGNVGPGATSAPFGENLCPVSVFDDGFRSSAQPFEPGSEVFWQTEPDDINAHSVRDASGLGLFDSGTMQPGVLFGASLNGAGTYPILDPTNGATSMVTVAVSAPESVPHRQRYVVRWGAHDLRAGLVFDVQVRREDGPRWTNWFRGTRAFESARSTSVAGTVEFRARVRRQGSTTATGWSPITWVFVT